jgi:hypothetical protein
VDPDERVLEQHVLAGRGFRLAGRHRGAARFRAHVLPDLEVPLGEVWPEPLGR